MNSSAVGSPAGSGGDREAAARPSHRGGLFDESRADWLLGTVLSSADPILAERIAGAFDLVWIDLEHSALTIRDAQFLAIAAKAGGAASLIRLPHSESELISAVLDAGPDGIVAPKINSPQQAERLARTITYPPAGSRGFAPRRASGARATLNAAGPACVVQIETQQAVDSAREIAAVPGVDALVVGTADLSLDLGAPLDMSSGDLVAAVHEVGQAARRAGKPWGVAIGSLLPWVHDLRRAGASMLVFSSDLRIYGEAVEQRLLELREITREA